jgi:hypothetical protein
VVGYWWFDRGVVRLVKLLLWLVMLLTTIVPFIISKLQSNSM